MKKTDRPALAEHFRNIEDPRIERNKRHELLDIIVLSLCAVICGSETWEDIEEYGQAKEQWLRRFLSLPAGIPSHDTIRRLFIRLDPSALQASFLSWVQALREAVDGEIVSVDGKTARRSYDTAGGKHPLHLVSAWASENRMVVGQMATEEKSNEITAIPALLELLSLHGCIVTIDAIGAQKDIVELIREKGAEYVIALKANQPTLHQDVIDYFPEQDLRSCIARSEIGYHKTVEKDHGRFERREYYCRPTDEYLKQTHPEWRDLASIGMVRSERTIGEKTSVESRYFIMSIPAEPELFATAVRTHWEVENCNHWTLDVVFREDESRMRSGGSQENFALFRRMALSIMKRDSSRKGSLKGRRKRAGWDDRYLERLLFAPDPPPQTSPNVKV